MGLFHRRFCEWKNGQCGGSFDQVGNSSDKRKGKLRFGLQRSSIRFDDAQMEHLAHQRQCTRLRCRLLIRPSLPTGDGAAQLLDVYSHFGHKASTGFECKFSERGKESCRYYRNSCAIRTHFAEYDRWKHLDVVAAFRCSHVQTCGVLLRICVGWWYQTTPKIALRPLQIETNRRILHKINENEFSIQNHLKSSFEGIAVSLSTELRNAPRWFLSFLGSIRKW